MSRRRISPQDAYKNFGNVFRSVYKPAKINILEKAAGIKVTDSIQAAGAATLGHPEYVNLVPGETRVANAVISFIDIRGFTKLSFVLQAEELLRIVQGLSQASINVITDGGGYIGEFTGDGVMAYFGDSSTSESEAVVAALETTSVLFKTVEEIVNPELKNDGIDPIRIAAGMEYGEVLWSRVGIGAASQIKPVANATFLAGKLSSSITSAWECKIGAQLARWVPDEFKEKAPQYGPYTVKGKQVARELYLLNWRKLANESLLDQTKFEQTLRSYGTAPGFLSGTKIVEPATKNTPGPRPLKDQPFFGLKK